MNEEMSFSDTVIMNKIDEVYDNNDRETVIVFKKEEQEQYSKNLAHGVKLGCDAQEGSKVHDILFLFDESGCSKMLAVYPEIDEKFLDLPLQMQAFLCDAVCYINAADAEWNENMLRRVYATFPHDPPFNVTGVGNIAFLATCKTVPINYREQWGAIAAVYSERLRKQAISNKTDASKKKTFFGKIKGKKSIGISSFMVLFVLVLSLRR